MKTFGVVMAVFALNIFVQFLVVEAALFLSVPQPWASLIGVPVGFTVMFLFIRRSNAFRATTGSTEP